MMKHTLQNDNSLIYAMMKHILQNDNTSIGINTHLVPKLFRNVQFGTQTLEMFNLVPKLFKRVYFSTFR